jgi:hypothetical protein
MELIQNSTKEKPNTEINELYQDRLNFKLSLQKKNSTKQS